MTDTPRYGTIDSDYGLTLATTAAQNDGPVWMVNLMKYRQVAHYADGRLSDISGQATRKSFIDMQALPTFQKSHQHKDAGMESTIVMGAQPMVLPSGPDGFETVDWADVPHLPTTDDGPVVVMHVIRFHDSPDGQAAAHQTPDHMEQYQTAAGKVALGHGVRINGWFAVEGTIIGDGRAWHQVRFNEFPSKAAFMAVVMDSSRLEAQKDHREGAIADTYTMIVRASLNELGASVES